MQSRIFPDRTTLREPRVGPWPTDTLYGALADLVRMREARCQVDRESDGSKCSRTLREHGVRAQQTMLRNGDDGSIAILDPGGLVVCWYARAGDRERSSSRVLARHVAQFYVPVDVVEGLPERHLRSAVACGYSYQDGWRLMATGHRFWGVTQIRVLLRSDGGLDGFLHVIRPAQGTAEGLRIGVPRATSACGFPALQPQGYAVAMAA